MINTIIFDAEGVVIDTEPMWDKSQKEFIGRRGLSYDRKKIKHLISGKSLVDGVKIMQKEYGFIGNPKKLAKERKIIIKKLFKSQLKFIVGFKDFNQKIKKRYKTCIATSMDKELLKIVDKKLKLLQLFDNKVFSIQEIGNVSKPNPNIFLYAANKLNSKPEDCLVIEDSPNGIEAAKRAGMKCIALTTTYSKDKLIKADLIVDSYPQIDLNKF